MITKDEATRRVARGLSWLKESGEQQGFHLDNVNLALLDISAQSRCVLAQAAGRDYSNIFDQLDMGIEWFAEHGFNVTSEEALLPTYAKSYDVLTAAWREALAEERLRTAATLILAA